MEKFDAKFILKGLYKLENRSVKLGTEDDYIERHIHNIIEQGSGNWDDNVVERYIDLLKQSTGEIKIQPKVVGGLDRIIVPLCVISWVTSVVLSGSISVAILTGISLWIGNFIFWAAFWAIFEGKLRELLKG